MKVALPKTGSEARRLGVNKYYTGLPCLRGHITARAAHNGQCCGCAKEASQRNSVKRSKQGIARAYYERQRSETPEKIMLMSARYRAKRFGVPCTITAKDIKECFPLDGICPVLGIKLENRFDEESGNGRDNSPSLDKLIPALGYVKGNIAVISLQANRLKSDETDPNVFRKLANWIEGNTK